MNSAAKRLPKPVEDSGDNDNGGAAPANKGPVDGWAKLKMEASAQGVPERAKFNPKRPPLKENFFEKERDDDMRTKLMEQTKTLIRSQLISAGKQGWVKMRNVSHENLNVLTWGR